MTLTGRSIYLTAFSDACYSPYFTHYGYDYFRCGLSGVKRRTPVFGTTKVLECTFGSEGGARAPDLLFVKQLLSQLGYTPIALKRIYKNCCKGFKVERKRIELLSIAYQTIALTIVLPFQIFKTLFTSCSKNIKNIIAVRVFYWQGKQVTLLR